MRSQKMKLLVLFGFLTLMAAVQPVLAANQYTVCAEAKFKWTATKYYYNKVSGTTLTGTYTLEFNFTNFASSMGVEYLNGTINNNGTSFVGELSHEYYYYGAQVSDWVTSIIDTQGDYKVYVYLICEVEIEQTTKPNLQSLASNTWIDMTETSTNNFTLSGSYTDSGSGDQSTYTGNIEFNSDKVLKHVYDDLKIENTGVLQSEERYEWTLTSYTKGTGTCGGGTGNGAVPGFPVYLTIAAIMLGFVVIVRKKKLTVKENLR